MLSMSGLQTRSACIVLMLTAMAPLLAGCNEPIAATAAAKPAEPEVGTFTVRPQSRALVRELPGRIAPTRVSEVRAQVSGIAVERLFQQGTEVKAGDPLYRIDPKPFQVELQASEAALAKANAALDLAAQHARRIATLTSQRAAPEVENEKAIAAHRQAEAEVGSRKAEVARAKLNLDYATIRAPISGAVGAARVAARYVCPRPERTAHRFRRHRGAAAGDPARCRRRQRSFRGQGRRPRGDAAGPHRRGAGRSLAGERGPQGWRPHYRRRLPEIRARRQGQREGVDRCLGWCHTGYTGGASVPLRSRYAQLLH